MEEEEIEVPVTKEQTKEAAKMETDEAPSDAAPPSTKETDVNMQDAKDTADAPGAETGVPESGDKPAQMETDAKVSRHDSYVFIPFVIFYFPGPWEGNSV